MAAAKQDKGGPDPAVRKRAEARKRRRQEHKQDRLENPTPRDLTKQAAREARREYLERAERGELDQPRGETPKVIYDFPPARFVSGGAPGSSRRH